MAFDNFSSWLTERTSGTSGTSGGGKEFFFFINDYCFKSFWTIPISDIRRQQYDHETIHVCELKNGLKENKEQELKSF